MENYYYLCGIKLKKDNLTIMPSAQMYLNYLAIYDGEWTAEQLGIANAAVAAAPRRASEPKIFTSTTNSYEFKDLNASNRYLYRVRAKGEENTYSPWSEQRTFQFSGTGINELKLDTDSPVRYYDLNGREISGNAKGIVIRKQGKDVRKVMR